MNIPKRLGMKQHSSVLKCYIRPRLLTGNGMIRVCLQGVAGPNFVFFVSRHGPHLSSDEAENLCTQRIHGGPKELPFVFKKM